jgi:hypothetical protein
MQLLAPNSQGYTVVLHCPVALCTSDNAFHFLLPMMADSKAASFRSNKNIQDNDTLNQKKPLSANQQNRKYSDRIYINMYLKTKL